ncbi:MAG TPA: ATP-binding protein [Roseateles sp.]|nr:ATP-binding protein [Roseateles sp.]
MAVQQEPWCCRRPARRRPAWRRRRTCVASRAGTAPSRPRRSPRPAGPSLLRIGPPGTGQSMLAQRLLGLLRPLSDEEALESATVLSPAGQVLAMEPMRTARGAFQPLQRGPGGHHQDCYV